MRLVLPIALHYSLYNKKKTHIHKDKAYRLNYLKEKKNIYIMLYINVHLTS